MNGKAITINYPFSTNGAAYPLTVSGLLAADTLSIAGLQVSNQTFALVTNESVLVAVYTLLSGANGIIGLAYPSTSIL